MKHVGLLTGSTGLAQIIALIASPLLARLYRPDDFGVLGFYSAALALLVVVASLRFPLAIPLPESDREAASILGLSLLINLVFVAGTLLLIVLLIPVLNQSSTVVAMGSAIWLIPIGVLGGGIYQTLSYWAIRKEAFRPLAGTKLTQVISSVVAQIALAIPLGGALGLIGGDVIGRSAGSRRLWSTTGISELTRDWTWNQLREVARLYHRFPLLSTGSALLNGLAIQLPSIVFIGMFGSQIAGWYALTYRVLNAPITLLGTAVGQVYLGHLGALYRERNPKLLSLFYRTLARLTLLAVPFGLALVFLGPKIFSWLFGTAWSGAGEMIPLLAPLSMMQLIVSPLSQTLNVFSRQDLQLTWDATRFALIAATFLAALTYGWGVHLTLGVYSGMMVLSYLWLCVMSIRVIRVATVEWIDDNRPA